jgi:23S rRNA pseudouridine1911/1915/1917 synthase
VHLDVLYEDNHLLLVNKPAGILVQKDKKNDDTNLEEIAKQYVKEKYNKPGEVFLGIPHRIDRPTSGIVILCRTSKALERVNEMFQKKEIKKHYWAIVKQKPNKPSDRLIHWLRKDEKLNKTIAYPSEVNGSQRAELTYDVISPPRSQYHHWSSSSD